MWIHAGHPIRKSINLRDLRFEMYKNREKGIELFIHSISGAGAHSIEVGARTIRRTMIRKKVPSIGEISTSDPSTTLVMRKDGKQQNWVVETWKDKTRKAREREKHRVRSNKRWLEPKWLRTFFLAMKNDQSQIPKCESPSTPCTRENLKEQEAWRDSVTTRKLGSNGCQKMNMETQTRHHCDQVARGWKSIEILSKLTDGQNNIADTWTASRRSDTSYTAPWQQKAAVREHHHVGVQRWGSSSWKMRARRKFSTPPTQIIASLRQEQRRQNSFIPKNERMRRRPFVEALRAESEWMRQNWRTYFSQSSSSSPSSQNWWQHEHQEPQWQEHQDIQWRDHYWQDHQGEITSGEKRKLQNLLQNRCGSRFSRFLRNHWFFN